MFRDDGISPRKEDTHSFGLPSASSSPPTLERVDMIRTVATKSRRFSTMTGGLVVPIELISDTL